MTKQQAAPRWGVWVEKAEGLTPAATAWLKREGVPLVFDSQAEATAEAERATQRQDEKRREARESYGPDAAARMAHMTYRARAMPPEGWDWLDT